jgi:subfamily B ATP-binding cassette protein MsbA
LGVPLVIKPITNITDVVYPPRNTAAEVYTQIDKDITEALSRLPTNGNVLSNGSVNNTLFKIRMNRFSTLALRARIAIYKSDWATAAAAANDVIASGRYTLYSFSSMLQDFRTQNSAESLFEVLDEPAEIDGGDYQVERSQGRIEFKNLSFSYPGSETPALNNINVTIEPGQTVALVGASGGGKSTMINLLPRFYEYEQGEILIDGVELKRYRLDSLRRQIALVTQNVTLFNASVANNIAYGALQGAAKEQIEQAAVDAYAMDFISKMPQGLETEIGENGVKLSGGQRQRLALARALLKDAPILILDEATSALDTESERYIQAALNRVMQGRTTLVVAHRLSTIESADVILVMEKGRIVEQGSHRELLARDGAYAKLHKMQFQDVGQTEPVEQSVGLAPQ